MIILSFEDKDPEDDLGFEAHTCPDQTMVQRLWDSTASTRARQKDEAQQAMASLEEHLKEAEAQQRQLEHLG